jgi:type I restriction enzyme R subunit
VDAAIALFSGKSVQQAKEIWLVEPAPVVIEQLKTAVKKLDTFMQSQGLACAPEQVVNLKGDHARAEFINHFKEVQRLKTRLDQYTDLTEDSKNNVEQVLPINTLNAFKGMYLETAQELKRKQNAGNNANNGTDKTVQELDFEFVLFSSSLIDYDYIMGLIAKLTQTTSKTKITRQQLIDLICSSSNLMDERDDIVAYINSLPVGQSLNEKEIREGYQAFKTTKANSDLADMAKKHSLEPQALQTFVDGIMNRMIFDGEQLSDLLAPLELGWKARTQKELLLMEDLVPMLHRRAGGREISGLAAYE